MKKLIIMSLFSLFCLIGWVVNIIKLTGCDFNHLGAEIVLRIVGIFVAPLGIILGYIGHF